ncbi:MAG: hypothetical protein ACXWB9_06805 [Flavisolibacter sp.]
MTRLTLFVLTLILCQHTQAQKAESALTDLEKNFPQEKLHLSLNKDAFVAGETIYFKAFVFSGQSPSLISTNLYVELYNEKKELLDSTSVPLVRSMGEGSLSLNKTFPEGNYFIRAYTRWMLNFDASTEYILDFPLYNPTSPQALQLKPVKWKASIHPESGTLIAGHANQVAVRLDAEGRLPSKWNGWLKEKDAQVNLLTFASLNSQVSSFNFTPVAGKVYEVIVKDEAGNEQKELLQPVSKGVVLKANQVKNRVEVNMIFEGLAEGGKGYKLLGQMDGNLVYSAVIGKSDPVIKTSIQAGALLNGVLHLTLFDASESAVAERLLIIRTDSLEQTRITTAPAGLEKRAFNPWDIQVDTSEYLSYAVSITDAGITAPAKRSLYSDLWLSDLSKNIHQPSWYFSSDDPNRYAALDALLISEKWKKFQWLSLMEGKRPALRYQPEQYLTYLGTASKRNKPMANEVLLLLFRFKDSSSQAAEVKTDPTGAFLVSNVAFFDSVQVFQLTKARTLSKDIDLDFILVNQHFPLRGDFPETPYTLGERKGNLPVIARHAQQHMRNLETLDTKYKQLEEVRIETRAKSQKQKLNEELSSALFQTGNEVLFDLVNEEMNAIGYPHIFDWLEGRVAGLSFAIVGDSYNPTTSSTAVPRQLIPGQRIPMMRDGEASLYLDEIPVDIDAIYTLPVSDIAMVKVIRGYFMGGNSGGGGSGAIAIYTKKGRMSGSSRKALPLATIPGYKRVPALFAPDYRDEVSSSLQSDTRDQLFWSAHLQPDDQGKLKFSFYNNDVSQALRVVVVGYTKYGKPVYFEKVFNR